MYSLKGYYLENDVLMTKENSLVVVSHSLRETLLSQYHNHDAILPQDLAFNLKKQTTQVR